MLCACRILRYLLQRLMLRVFVFKVRDKAVLVTRRQMTVTNTVGRMSASYLQRLAGVLRSRHLRWQPAHDALNVSAVAIIWS
jgi:hypothetical protein